MLEFVDSDLYFVQDKNNFINLLLQVGSGSGSAEKSTGSGGPKINGSDRIRIRSSSLPLFIEHKDYFKGTKEIFTYIGTYIVDKYTVG